MAHRVAITDLRFIEAPEAATRAGLLGWVRFTLNDLVVLDGIALRRARGSGDLLLSWPSRHDRGGTQHPVVLPVQACRDEVNRRILEQARAILESLGRRGIKSTEAAP
jgi:DNA-binding cell septation regulator SpoVG